MFKIKKNRRTFIFLIIIVFLLFYLSIVTCKYMYKSNNTEGFNIRRYYNSNRRNFNRLKNKYLYDGKIKIKRLLKDNNII